MVTPEKMNFKVIQESYIESHTEHLDKTQYKRILSNSEGTIKITMEQAFEFSEMFNRGEELAVDFMQIQTKLK